MTENAKPDNESVDRPAAATAAWLALPVLALVLLSPFLFYQFIHHGRLATCDDAIRRTLKAPSTYRRIDASDDGNLIEIEYDAENLFGVPLRSKGTCLLDGNGAASWPEAPAP